MASSLRQARTITGQQWAVIWTLEWTSGWLLSYLEDKQAHRDSLSRSRKHGQVKELDRAGTRVRQAKVPGHKIWGGAASQGHAMPSPTPNLHKGKSEPCIRDLILWGAGPTLAEPWKWTVTAHRLSPTVSIHYTILKAFWFRRAGNVGGYSSPLVWREELENEHEFCWNTEDTYRLE